MPRNTSAKSRKAAEAPATPIPGMPTAVGAPAGMMPGGAVPPIPSLPPVAPTTPPVAPGLPVTIQIPTFTPPTQVVDASAVCAAASATVQSPEIPPVVSPAAFQAPAAFPTFQAPTIAPQTSEVGAAMNILPQILSTMNQMSEKQASLHAELLNALGAYNQALQASSQELRAKLGEIIGMVTSLVQEAAHKVPTQTTTAPAPVPQAPHHQMNPVAQAAPQFQPVAPAPAAAPVAAPANDPLAHNPMFQQPGIQEYFRRIAKSANGHPIQNVLPSIMSVAEIARSFTPDDLMTWFVVNNFLDGQGVVRA